MLRRADELTAAAITPNLAALAETREDRERLRRFAETWAGFTVYTDASLADARAVSDEATTLTAVLDKWSVRGVPTLIDALVPSSIPCRRDALKDKRTRDELLVGAVRYLCQAPATENYRQLAAELPGAASKEERLFYEACRRNLPPAAFARMVPQASMQSIGVELPKAADLRVDFALLLKSNWKWVVEIDGRQHEETVHAAGDRARDAALHRANWRTFRITAEAVRADADAAVERWIHAMGESGRKVLESMRVPPCEADRWQDAAYTEMAFPCAVQRCLRAWVHALRLGLLPYDSAWEPHLSGPEWEAPYVALGVLRRWWRYLHDLGWVENSPPEVKSVRCDRLPESLIPEVEELPSPTGPGESPATLRLDFSAALPPGMHGEAEVSEEAPTLYVRCSYRCLPERRLRSTQRKFYPTVEELVAQRGPEAEAAHQRAAEAVLKTFFCYPSFREGQYASVSRLIAGKDTVTLLPTGGGKSAVIHLSGLLLPGASLVIEPLVALLTDQVENLRSVFCDANEFIDSSLSGEERERVMRGLECGSLHTLFISPERLQLKNFRQAVSRAGLAFPIGLAAVDEAHCVSEWGHDFRPAYLHLVHNLRKFARSLDSSPVISALTGTASYAVLSDIQAEIGIRDERALVTPTSFGRKEIQYEVLDTRGNWQRELKALKRRLPEAFGLASEAAIEDPASKVGGIIFCSTVNSPYGASVQTVCAELGHRNLYSGTKPKCLDDLNDWDWAEHKRRVLLDFKADKIQEVIASKSIGMGFDKPNVRYCIHTSLPESIESFYQESGRAGRDGRPGARSYILIDRDTLRHRGVWEADTIQQSIERMNDAKGEWGTPAYFLQQGFPGVKEEAMGLVKFLNPFLGAKGVEVIQEAKDTEKCLFRGIMLGVIEDYTKEFRSGLKTCYKVTVPDVVNAGRIIASLKSYLRRCKFDDYVNERFAGLRADMPTEVALEQCVDIYMRYIYEEVLSRRLQSLKTMAELCLHFKNHDAFKSDMLDYLSESEYTEVLKEWLGKSLREIPNGQVKQTLSGARTMQEMNLLLGTARRSLDNDPNNAAVLWLAITTGIKLHPDRHQGMEIKRLLRLTRGELGEQGLPYDLAVELWGLLCSDSSNHPILEEMKTTWFGAPKGIDFARHAVREYANTPFGRMALNHLLERAAEKTRNLLNKL